MHTSLAQPDAPKLCRWLTRPWTMRTVIEGRARFADGVTPPVLFFDEPIAWTPGPDGVWSFRVDVLPECVTLAPCDIADAFDSEIKPHRGFRIDRIESIAPELLKPKEMLAWTQASIILDDGEPFAIRVHEDLLDKTIAELADTFGDSLEIGPWTHIDCEAVALVTRWTGGRS